MPVMIDLSGEAEQALKSKAKAEGLSAEIYARRLLERDLGIRGRAEADDPRPLQTAADIVLRHMGKVPDEMMNRLPKDGASQHDHYIYGTPKRGLSPFREKRLEFFHALGCEQSLGDLQSMIEQAGVGETELASDGAES